MLNYRLHKCMDLIVEGVDTGNVRLILQESAAFQSAFNELKGSIDDFVKLIGKVGLEGLKEPYAALAKAVDEAEQSLQDMPDEWEWKGQVNALKKPSGDSPPETMVSKIALDHDTNVNAVKDGVIAIAKFLEPFPEFFNVGSAGISMTDAFKKCLDFPEEIGLWEFGVDDWMYTVTGVEKSSDQTENEKKMKEHWKPMWDPQGAGEDKKWTDFQGQLEKLSSGIPKLYGAAGEAIADGKPSDDFQAEVPDEGLVKNLLGALFGGGGGGTKIDPKKVMGQDFADPDGLLGLDMSRMSVLITGLLEMSGAASDAASGAVEAIDKNQQELEQDIPSKEVRDKLIKGFGEKPKDEGDLPGMPKTSKAMVAFQQILDKKDFTLKDISEVEGLKEKLTKVKQDPYTKEEDIDELLEILELTSDDSEGTPDNIEDDLKDLLATVEDDSLKDELVAMLQDEYIDGEEGEIKPKEDNDTDDLVKDLEALDDPDGEVDNELKQGLVDLLDPEKLPESFVRWGKLAGIIKG